MTDPWGGANEWGIDLAAAALFGGAKHGESFSHMSAVHAIIDKKRSWCVVCWLLSRLVEPNHCHNVLAVDSPPTSQAALNRAGFWLVVAMLALWALPLAVYLLLRWAL